MPTITVRRAGPDEAAQVAGILTEAATWLRDKDLWNDWPVPWPVSLVEERMDAAEFYLAHEPGGTAVGTFSLRWDDEDYWGDQPPDAGYLHQLAVLPTMGGRGVGPALLDWVGAEIRRRGRAFLRLDCPVANAGLCAYYDRQGFRRVGERTTAGGYHAALYERAVIS